jgi:hypothetical protein
MPLNESQIQLVAQICHEANHAYCQSIGDTGSTSWAAASTEQKSSVINGVMFILAEEGRPRDPWESHENWLKAKVAAGWTYGANKDEQAKTHPCIKPWGDLPEEQRRKDVIFLSVAKGAISALNRVL